MTLRELLRIEIWSKRTSRRLMIGFAVVVVLLAVLDVTETRWITPAEGRTARAALAQIDRLQNLGVMNDSEYRAASAQAKAAVSFAEQAAKTQRDDQIVSVLSGYLMLTDMERNEQQLQLKWSASPNERFRKLSVRDPRTVSGSKASREFLSQVLHRALG